MRKSGVSGRLRESNQRMFRCLFDIYIELNSNFCFGRFRSSVLLVMSQTRFLCATKHESTSIFLATLRSFIVAREKWKGLIRNRTEISCVRNKCATITPCDQMLQELYRFLYINAHKLEYLEFLFHKSFIIFSHILNDIRNVSIFINYSCFNFISCLNLI